MALLLIAIVTLTNYIIRCLFRDLGKDILFDLGKVGQDDWVLQTGKAAGPGLNLVACVGC